MKANKMLITCLLILMLNLYGGQAFAGTGGPSDGQVMLLAILAVLTVIFGLLIISPWLVQQIRDLWKRYHHC